ncbi:MAG: CBS domain-containing protein [Gemmatimonadota bacterium]
MKRPSIARVTPQHTTAEAVEIMRDTEQDVVLVVDSESKQLIGRISQKTIIGECVRAWHEPARCRVGRHVQAR